MALGRAVQLPGLNAMVLQAEIQDVVHADATWGETAAFIASGVVNDPTRISIAFALRFIVISSQ